MAAILCGRYPERSNGMDAWRATFAGPGRKRHGATAETAAPRSGTPACNREGTRPDAAVCCVEDGSMETGSKEKTHFMLRRRSCEMCSPELLARRTACGRMAADRMAK